MSISQPVNQKRHTNISIVRLKRGGKRFEIACYPNKVLSWRKKIETDIEEVLQSHSVFMNVSKGVLAGKAELKRCFDCDDNEKICLMILEKGELQVGEKERAAMKEQAFRDVATIVAEKCINTETQRPCTVAWVERAMKEIHFNVNTNKPSKVQALQVAQKLESEEFPIQRAQMRLRLTIPPRDSKRIKSRLKDHLQDMEKEERTDEGYVMTFLADPGAFRVIEDTTRKITKRMGIVEVVNPVVTQEGDKKIE
eukprot:TRINITY_DN16835_c0_g1_i1.p1 TRINITY_DN16835_c0_g1~~TRINITY_DN16835_c0_g1_i1.p1  ORF type:complete len:263 (-),score=40.71 TRINITY_DN16835_c0_g1_i1:35-793(-)